MPHTQSAFDWLIFQGGKWHKSTLRNVILCLKLLTTSTSFLQKVECLFLWILLSAYYSTSSLCRLESSRNNRNIWKENKLPDGGEVAAGVLCKLVSTTRIDNALQLLSIVGNHCNTLGTSKKAKKEMQGSTPKLVALRLRQYSKESTHKKAAQRSMFGPTAASARARFFLFFLRITKLNMPICCLSYPFSFSLSTLAHYCLSLVALFSAFFSVEQCRSCSCSSR